MSKDTNSSEKALQDKLKTLLKKYRKKAQKQYKNSNRSDSNQFRVASGSVKMKKLVHSENDVQIKDQEKQCGYDELFKVEYHKNGFWHESDKKFKIEEDENNNFDAAFLEARVPTNSYIHFRKRSGSTTTTGHPGGFLISTREFKKYKGEKKGSDSKTLAKKVRSLLSEIDLSDEEELREVSSQIPSIIKESGVRGNTAGRTNGSYYFHKERDSVIKEVISEAERSGDEEFKTRSAKTATAEALKFMINNTVGYQDNTPENNDKFKGITIGGLNLEDEESREFALKHYQANRDAMKLTVLKLEDRLNDDDSSAEYESESSSSSAESEAEEGFESDLSYKNKIALINAKLERTTLDDKYDKKTSKRSLSPLRSSTPYSDANIEFELDLLDKAEDLSDICSAINTPIPVIEKGRIDVEPVKEKNQLIRK